MCKKTDFLQNKSFFLQDTFVLKKQEVAAAALNSLLKNHGFKLNWF